MAREMALLHAFGILAALPTVAGDDEHKGTKTENVVGGQE